MKSAAVRCLLTLTLSLLAACAGWHWPWRHAPAAAPVPVNELQVDAAGQSSPRVQQFWNRNNLRVDLTALSGSGALRLLPRAPNGWPVRIEFAARPGSFHNLEVRGAQRTLFSVADSGDTQIFVLAPGSYTADTAALEIRWY